jgi:hypothetical protein
MTRVMEEGIQYEVHFANGDVEIAETLEGAQTIVMQRTGHDQESPGLHPMEIWKTGPNNVGVGNLVSRIP